jgi:hypothetical protein
MKPSREYLELLDELLECRDDVSLNLVKDQLQKLINRESDCIAQDVFFLESYKWSKTAVHLHGQIRFIPSGFRWNFCAMIQGRMSATAKTASEDNLTVHTNSPTGDVKVSVFVDVRQSTEKSQGIIDGTYPIVRLHALDKCKYRIRNSGKSSGETTLRQRGMLSRPKFSAQGKIAMFKPFGVNTRNIRIPLNDIEYQVVEGGSHLIDHFASENGNLARRVPGDSELFCFFALSLGELMGVTAGIQGNASFESLEMLSRPSQFTLGRIDAANPHLDMLAESGQSSK